MKRKMLKVRELEPGMFVEELDRPWLETPYLLQGILIQSEEDISELAKFCEFVYVSFPDTSIAAAPPFIIPPVKRKSIVHVIPDDDERTIFHGDVVYLDKTTVEEELPAAKSAYNKAHELIEEIKQQIEVDSKLNTNTAKELVSVIASSVVNNPNAMLLLNSFKAQTNEEYERSLSVAIYMIAFGRHLCLPKDELVVLGLGGLLMDIGHIQLISKPTDEINVRLTKIGKSEAHVLCGQQILANLTDIPRQVIDITMQHHEREDGSGYPSGLGSNCITPYARMAAIVDCYVDLIAQDSETTPFQALTVLWDWSRSWLNATLVSRFAHSIGLFPVGSLIELSTSEVAVVLAHNRVDRLKPLIMILLNAEKKPYDAPKTVDLSLSEAEEYKIIGDIKPNTYNIDTQKYYL